MDVSIIIVNYNTKDLTLNCINSIIEKTHGVKYEIILVDNASTDGSKDVFNINPHIKYIYNNENFGFGKANNIGFQQSIGKYIFFLNSDTVLLNNAIKILYDFTESCQNIGAVGGVLYDHTGINPTCFSGKFPTITNVVLSSLQNYLNCIFRNNSVQDFNKFIKGEIFKVDFITGADLFIPRSVIQHLGLFDEKFFMYYEETDLQKRMQLSNYERYIVQDAKIIHLEGASQQNVKSHSNRKRYQMTKSMFIYFDKYYSPLMCIIFRILYFITQLPHFINWNTGYSDKYNLFKIIFKM